ncbi:MAG: TlpA family protein disulfide reductase [Flammeovirgaceae bacterium]|nr:TlpA family protein disulfide reductase [Flammeovirgaceae bacterium]
MKFKIVLFSGILLFFLGVISFIFWQQELKYIQPTPKPANLVKIEIGDSISIPEFDFTSQKIFIHFYNYSCPCSRFNIKEFQSLVRKYSGQVNFIAVLQTTKEDEGAVKEFKEKYNLGIPILEDPKGKIAKTLGVYSTPQAVVLDENKIFYKGNYNKARFCLSSNTKFADLALNALVNQHEPPEFPELATIAYGCELPSNSLQTDSKIISLFNF